MAKYFINGIFLIIVLVGFADCLPTNGSLPIDLHIQISKNCGKGVIEKVIDVDKTMTNVVPDKPDMPLTPTNSRALQGCTSFVCPPMIRALTCGPKGRFCRPMEETNLTEKIYSDADTWPTKQSMNSKARAVNTDAVNNDRMIGQWRTFNLNGLPIKIDLNGLDKELANIVKATLEAAVKSGLDVLKNQLGNMFG